MVRNETGIGVVPTSTFVLGLGDFRNAYEIYQSCNHLKALDLSEIKGIRTKFSFFRQFVTVGYERRLVAPGRRRLRPNHTYRSTCELERVRWPVMACPGTQITSTRPESRP